VSSSVKEAVTQFYLSQPLEEALFPIVKIFEYFRPSRIAFTPRNKGFPAVLGDQLIDKFRNALIRLDPVTVSATKHRIFDIREQRVARQVAQPLEEVRGIISRLAYHPDQPIVRFP